MGDLWLIVRFTSMSFPDFDLLRTVNADADTGNRPGPMVKGSDGLALQKKIWEQLVAQLEDVQPGITQNI